MTESANVKQYDVLILGAGPGGTSCALALHQAGLKVAIIDKSEFPRDKVCGELLHKKAVETLNAILPGFEKDFIDFPKTLVLKHTTVHYKGKSLTFDWVSESYTCPRLEFDNYLLNTVRKYTSTDIFTATVPDKITVTDDGVTLTIKNSPVVYSAKMIIGADGAHSTVAKQLTEKTLDRAHYLGAVRAYYKNVKNTDNFTSEVFFSSKYNLNYLWVFPIEGNLSNVGFGLLSSNISENKINLKESFYDYFKQSPELAEKFANAEQVSTLEGFGVPLGSTIGTVSGKRFMLIGDAASLSNPLSGTGMGNAVMSGKIAADQLIRSFKANDFSAEFMKGYDNVLQSSIVDGLYSSYKAQRTLSKLPFLLDIVFFIGKNKRIRKYIQSIV